MKKISTLLAALALTISCAQGIDTQTRNDAGASGAGVKSGFYQADAPLNFPAGATNWWHLLDVRHTEPSNNYTMQFSGSFFDQELYFRKTQNIATQPWRKIVMEDNSGNVEIKGLTKSGNHTISSYSPLLFLDRDTGSGGYIQGVQTRLQDGTNNWFFGNLQADNFIIKAGAFDSPKLFTLNRNGNASLEGKLEAKEIKVTTTPTADFVFEEDYNLPKLEDVEKHIKEKKHLPEIASAKEMEKEGVNIGEFQIKLLQKIEELTLYSIEQNKNLKEQAERIKKLEEQLSIKK